MADVRDVEIERDFDQFVAEVEPKLTRALVGGYGSEIGREVTRDALTYAWEHWDRISQMENPAGYLYRVGQSRSRRYRRFKILFPDVATPELPDVDPRLPLALAQLSYQQRAALVLLHVEGFSEREAADALGVSRGTLRRHAERGLNKLRNVLGVIDVH